MVFRRADVLIHKDINPNNVLVSDVDSQKPIVKAIRSWSRYVLEHVLPLEYLNMSMLRKNSPVIPSEGFDEWQLQGLAIRAPETWKGVLPAPPCDVWSVGVTVSLNASLYTPKHILIPQIASTLSRSPSSVWARRPGLPCPKLTKGDEPNRLVHWQDNTASGAPGTRRGPEIQNGVRRR